MTSATETGFSKGRRRKFLALTMAALTLIVIVGLQLQTSEPAYDGKRVSELLAQYDIGMRGRSMGGQPPGPGPEVDHALRAIGTNAIPTLLRMISAHDGETWQKLFSLLRKQGVLKFTFKEPRVLRFEAGRGFWVLGAMAKPAVPGLIEIYSRSLSVDVRRSVIGALGCIGPGAAECVPLLISATTNADAEIREATLYALGSVHSRAEISIPALLGVIHGTNLTAGVTAITQLEYFGVQARLAVPELMNLTKGPDLVLRELATVALERIAPATAAKQAGQ